jgi:hypothetical protein
LSVRVGAQARDAAAQRTRAIISSGPQGPLFYLSEREETEGDQVNDCGEGE